MVAARAVAAGRRAQRAADRARRRRLRAARLLRLRHRDARPSTRLAAEGVRLANFHTTALCSPTRSCLLTGRNHHRNGMGRVADLAIGYPGYWGMIPRENGFLSEILRAHGYATYAVGKWHLTPDDEVHMAASRASWPLGRGFDRWYGFHGGETHQFVPALYHDNHAVLAPGTYEDGYHLSADLADRAIEFLSDLRAVDDDQPFFCYLATGACHSPHHAPAGMDRALPRTVRRGLGRVARRDVRPPARERARSRRAPRCRRARRGCRRGTSWRPRTRPSRRGSWSASPRSSRTPTRSSAACSTSSRETGDLDNTLIMLCSDNGASSEGGARGSINDVRLVERRHDRAPRAARRASTSSAARPTHNNYPWGWTMAGNTPFKRWKREVHEGGVADPCIVRCPPAPAATRRRAASATSSRTRSTCSRPCSSSSASTRPTAIDGVAQSPIDGTSFAATRCADADAPERHDTQYFEMLGSRAIYHQRLEGGDVPPARRTCTTTGSTPNAPFDDDVWELYNVADDLSETEDLAAKEPERLAGDGRAVVGGGAPQRRAAARQPSARARSCNPRPRRRGSRQRYVYRPYGAPVPGAVGRAPAEPRAHDHRRRRDRRRRRRAEGVLLAMGSALGGFAFYLRDGRLRYVHNLYAQGAARRSAPTRCIAPGRARARVRVHEDEGTVGSRAAAASTVASSAKARSRCSRRCRSRAPAAGSRAATRSGPAIGDDYVAPFRCNATIRRVVVDVAGEHERDPMAVFQAIMSEQ